MKPPAGLWHWSPADPGAARLSGVDKLCRRARAAGLDYITFKALDSARERFLTDSQLAEAKRECERTGLEFSLWQYVSAKDPPREEARAFAKLIKQFDPTFVFVDVEKEYESNPNPVSKEYASAFRDALPHFPAIISPFGRADLHPGIDYEAWHDHGFGVAPQAYECETGELSPAKCAHSFSKFWPVEKQWTAVGFYKGAAGRLSGAEIGRSLRGLPLANISGWRSGEVTDEQMRGIATHHGPIKAEPTADERDEPERSAAKPDVSIETVQRHLNACGFTVKVDNKQGRHTRKALHFFQLGWCGKHSLEDADGELTPATLNALAWSARHGGVLGPRAKNFHYQEFRLDNTGDPRVRRKVGLKAQAYREKFGATTILSSGRSVAHNDAVGGASNSRHLFPKFWDAIDPAPQVHSVAEVQHLGDWTGIGHHAAAPQAVDHIDLRSGFSESNPSVFADH